MSAHRIRYGGLLLAALLLLGFPRGAEAQTTTDVRGTIQLRLSGGLRLTNPEYDVPPFVADLYDQRSYIQAEADVPLSQALSVSAVLAFLRDSDRYARICPASCPDIETGFRLFMPEARVKYHRRQRSSDLYVGAGVGYGFGRLTEQEAAEGVRPVGRPLGEASRASASGPDFSFFSGFSYNPTRRLSLFGETGYRSLKADFSSEDDAFSPPPYRFDGPFALAGVGLAL